MWKLRIFLAIINVMVAVNSMACGNWMEWSNIKPFTMRMPIRTAISENNVSQQNAQAETLKFWYGYIGGSINRDTLNKAITELKYETFTNNQLRKNQLTAYLLNKKDNHALSYLRYNTEMMYGTGGDEWEYHDPYTTTQWRALLVKLTKLPASGKLGERILFLKLRCLFKIGRYKDCITFWNTRLKNNVKNASLLKRMKGYIGGAYFWMKRYNEAIDIFQKCGDIQSINTAINHMLTLTSKESLYAHDPNSLALEYAMQDYANYYYEYMAMKSQSVSSPDMYDDFEQYGNGILKSVNNDYNRTIAFAQKVLSDGLVTKPRFWAGFIGFMKWVHGDADEAYKWLVKAEFMQGTDRMAFCTRTYKFLAAMEMKNKPANFDDYFIKEYKYYMDNAKWCHEQINKEGYSSIPPEREMAWNLLTPNITPEARKYYASRGAFTSLLIQAVNDRYGVEGNADGMGAGYIQEMDYELSIEQDKDILRQFNAGGSNNIDKELLKMCGTKILSNELICDIIGTKLLRELRFSEAEEYLSKVSLAYLNNQGIAPYLALRKMPSTPFKRQDTKDYWEDDTQAKLTSNVKVQFAHDMAARQARMNLLTGDARAEAEYEMANYIFQSSSLGDLWALTEYGWSSCEDSCSMAPKIGHLLKEAITYAQNLKTKKKIWYAMMTIRSGEHDFTLDWDEKTNKYFWDFSNITTWQSEGISSLASNITSSDAMYLSCDILKSYINRK